MRTLAPAGRLARLLVPAALVAACLLVAPSAASAQTEERTDLDVAALGRTVQAVAKDAIPKTVLIKAHVGGMGGGQAGYGSGAIITDDGYILTCSHVVDIANRVEVVLSDGTYLDAKVLGKNKRQDYALLKVEVDHALSFFEKGDSSAIEVGDWMVALGHPGGPYPDLRPGVSFGRVTGLHRKLPVQMFDRYYNDAIQTDCPIYAGNSGGPLVDLDGKLLGLNGAILLVNDNAYAVPINEIDTNLDTLMAGRDVEGIKAGPEAFAEMQQNFSQEDMNEMYGRVFENFGKLFGGGESPDGENPMGDLFKQFFGGGGEEAPDGENPMGEMFKQFFGGGGEAPDGENPMGELFKQFFGGGGEAPDGENPMGELFKQFFGGGEEPAPEAPRTPERAIPTPPAGSGFLGVQVEPENGEDEEGGVIVEDVVADGPAAKAGLKKGDVIRVIDGEKIDGVEGLVAAVSGKGPGEKVKLQVIRARILDSEWIQEELVIEVELGRRE